MKGGYVYILASRKCGTLYIGVTADIITRISQHKEKIIPGFSKKYNTTRLVYYEAHSCIEDAILREKQMKKWKRGWKIELIESVNPNWNDLFSELI